MPIPMAQAKPYEGPDGPLSEIPRNPLVSPDPMVTYKAKPNSPMDKRFRKALAADHGCLTNEPFEEAKTILEDIHAEFPLPEDFTGTHALILRKGKLVAIIWHDSKPHEVDL